MEQGVAVSIPPTDWEASIVLAPNMDYMLGFCVDYSHLNAMKVRDAYPILKMDECIDSLGT